jgi:hypothetical protein
MISLVKGVNLDFWDGRTLGLVDVWKNVGCTLLFVVRTYVGTTVRMLCKLYIDVRGTTQTYTIF